MPEIKLKKVLSFSSEDAKFNSSNLISSDSPWKCSSSSHPQSSVVLELDSLSRVQSICIGNCGSAFVEILVSRALADSVYEVLVASTALMTMQDSRAKANMNTVHTFKENDLLSPAKEQRWDRMKFVCKQPFNKEIQYGLSFVRVFGEASSGTLLTSATASTLTETSSPSFKPGAFFNKEKLVKKTSINTEIREANKEAEQRSVLKRKSPQSDDSTAKRIKPLSAPVQTSSVSSNVSKKPFSTLFEGVVFVLSGFQTPFRGELRQKAVDMGALYRPDWSSTCTHLICAFNNTPKFNQVKTANGLIVKKEWIIDSFKQRKRLQIKHYSMLPLSSSFKDILIEEDLAHNDSKSNDCREEIDHVEYDTDEEIKKVQKESDPGNYDADTDVEDDLPVLPNFFEKLVFYIYGDVSTKERKHINRLVVAYGGNLENYMTDDVNIVLTNSPWCGDFDSALKNNTKLEFLKPEFLNQCDAKQSRVKLSEFRIK